MEYSAPADSTNAPESPRWRGPLLLALAVALIHGLLLFDVWSDPTVNLRGWPGDNLLMEWNLWWVQQSLFTSSSSLHCPILFAPDGFRFLFHSHHWLYGIIYSVACLPWRIIPALGDPPGTVLFTNLLQVFSSIATALAVWGIAGIAGVRGEIPKAIAALLVTFCAFRLFSFFGHLNYVGTEFMLLSLWMHLRALRNPVSRAWWIGGGAMVALAWMNDSTFGMFALYWFAMVFAVGLLKVGKTDKRQLMIGAALSVGALTLLAGRVFIELYSVMRSPDYFVLPPEGRPATDLWNVLLPSDFTMLFGPRLHELRQANGVSPGEDAAFLGWSTMFLVLCAAWILRHRIAQWKSCSAITWVLGLSFAVGAMLLPGSDLVIAGKTILPLPGLLQYKLPVLANLRAPDRHVLFLLLPMAVLAARSLDTIRARPPVLVGIITGAAFLFLADIAWNPRITTKVSAHPVALPGPLRDALRADPRAGTLLNLPYSYVDSIGLRWQLEHRKPIITGRAARVPMRMIERRYTQFPVLLDITHERAGGPIPGAQVTTAGGEQLTEMFGVFDVRWVLLHRELWPTGEDLLNRPELPLRRIAESEAVILYEVRP